MADPAGEADGGALRLDFDRRVMLQFHGSAITSDGGLLAYRELDDVLALTTSGGERLAEARTGRNRRHLLVGLLRQSVFGRLAGYEDVNDADRLCRDPAMRWVVGGKAPMDRAASASQMGRFETEWLAGPEKPRRARRSAGPMDRRGAQAAPASRSSWRDFLLGLKARGHGVEFVVADDHAGLRAAPREVLAEAGPGGDSESRVRT